MIEILRVAYARGPIVSPLSIGLSVVGASIVVWLRRHLAGNGTLVSESRPLLPSKATHIVLASHVVCIILVLSAVIVLQTDFPGFLTVQLALLTNLWLDNRRLDVSLNIMRASLILTLVYVGYLLLLSGSIFIGFITPAYLASWLGVQIMLEQPRLRPSASDVTT